MKKLAYAATLAGALALVACGGGDDGGVDIPDGGGGGDVDGGGDPVSCNPVNQMGCEQEEKCTWVIENPDMGLGRTKCVANGDVGPGGACETNPDTGDNCMATDGKGYTCINSECREVCSFTPSSTCSDGTCVGVQNLFDDVDATGICAPACDPTLQDCDAEGEACYDFLTPEGWGGICFRPAPGSEEFTQGDDCTGNLDQCSANGCAEGYGPRITDGQGNQACGYYCQPVDTHTEATEGAKGDMTAMRANGDPAYCDIGQAGANSQCRFFQTFFQVEESEERELLAGDMAPETLGICASTEVGNDCTEFNLDVFAERYASSESPEDFAAVCTDDNDEILPECNWFGCVSITTFNDAIDAKLAEMARTREDLPKGLLEDFSAKHNPAKQLREGLQTSQGIDGQIQY